MIVRMNWFLRAERAAELEIGGIRNHFIDIHVGLRAGSGLPYEQRKVPVQFAVGDILRNRRDGCRAPAIERSERPVDLGRRALDHTERAHDLDRHTLGSDAEIVERALGLSAPESVSRNLQWPEGVAFDAGPGR